MVNSTNQGGRAPFIEKSSILVDELESGNLTGETLYPELCREPGVYHNIRKNQIMQKSVPIDQAVHSINPREIYNYLRTKGIPHNHTVGIVNNIGYESGFKSDVIDNYDKSSTSGSGGLLQLSGARFDLMFCQIGANWRRNWKGQLDYMLSEDLTRKYLSQSFSTADQASAWFTMKWLQKPNPVAESKKRLSTISRYQSFKNHYPG